MLRYKDTNFILCRLASVGVGGGSSVARSACTNSLNLPHLVTDSPMYDSSPIYKKSLTPIKALNSPHSVNSPPLTQLNPIHTISEHTQCNAMFCHSLATPPTDLLTRPAIDPDTLTVLNMRFCPYAQRTILCLNAKEADYRVRKRENVNNNKKCSASDDQLCLDDPTRLALGDQPTWEGSCPPLQGAR